MRKLSGKSLALIGASMLGAGAPASAATLDARDFGVTANDSRGDADGLQKALYAASRSGGGEVLLPRGMMLVEKMIDMPSNVTLRGAGCDRSILRRSRSLTGQIMFRLDGVRNVSVRGVHFDYQGAPGFFRAIGFRGKGSSNINISGNCFTETKPIETRADRWAIELSSNGISRNIDITDNRVESRLQLTAGGGRGLQNVRIAGNEIRGAKANGIGLSTLSNNAFFDNIVIERNRIYDAQSIGIFIGPDKPSSRGGTFSNIRISENQIIGLRHKFSYGLFLRAPADGFSSLRIYDNVLDGRGSAKAIAIRLLDDHGKATREFRDVEICGNRGQNVSRGIWLQAVNGARIGRNSMAGARPFTAEAKYNRALEEVRYNCAA